MGFSTTFTTSVGRSGPPLLLDDDVGEEAELHHRPDVLLDGLGVDRAPTLVTIAALMASTSTRRLPSTSMAATVGPDGSAAAGSGSGSGGHATAVRWRRGDGGRDRRRDGRLRLGARHRRPASRHTSAAMGRVLLTEPRNLVHARENLKGNWPSFRAA